MKTFSALGAVIALAAVPFLVGLNEYYLFLVTLILLYTTIVVAWQLIGGYGGQLDLGAGAYHGLGAVITGFLMVNYGVSGWVGLLVSGAAAAGVAFLIGYPSFRLGLKEVWYALSSLALVLILQKIFLLWTDVAGPLERYIPYAEFDPLFMRAGTKIFYYYITAALLAATFLIVSRIRRSKTGLYLISIRENEEAAEMLGVDVRRYKLQALMIYSFIAAVTGGIYASMVGFYHPTLFDSWISIQTATLAIVGGLGHLLGPPIVSIILLTVQEYLRITLGAVIIGLHQVIFGIILVIIIMFKPDGLGPLIDSLAKRFTVSSGR
ncbi:branched-chain amino acid ABC transporter permease [Candidatus Caldarchaeum subterraneum]|uniref:Branched-chain amino acid transport system permease protein n=2 Tax=Thermoproteati TaxID=1783275 RepID=H5SNP0_9CREN|nr:branched-chain amino acid ABC transporter permease [Candidatus Caldarchaeum subterraneum]BAJ51238.1 branched-chain amino acid ABC transporter permease [Candidatus Caldarchaeum subterraneum]BAL57776.1 branched-chain amino acid transport system permease protein [uncultured crenarchaeote]